MQLLGIRGWRGRAEMGMNGGVLWGRPRPGRGCGAIYGWMDDFKNFEIPCNNCFKNFSLSEKSREMFS